MDRTKTLAERTETVLYQWQTAARHLTETVQGPNLLAGYVHACPLMQVTGDVVMAWMLLWRAALAQQQLAAGAKKKDVDFYEGQIKSAEFFIQTVLPTTLGKMNGIVKGNGSAVEISEAAFGG